MKPNDMKTGVEGVWARDPVYGDWDPDWPYRPPEKQRRVMLSQRIGKVIARIRNWLSR